MSGLRAGVEKGRLVLDEPTTLPGGTVVDLVADDEGDDATEDERRVLHEAPSASWKSAKSGRVRPATAIVDELRHLSKRRLASLTSASWNQIALWLQQNDGLDHRVDG